MRLRATRLSATGNNGRGALNVFVGVLDGLGVTPAAAFSTRRLSGAYSGPAMRVRRSADNAEQDIGYTGAGELDADALLTFVGSGNGFVRTWYDQSGNARDVGNLTTSAQPRIVNVGALDTANGKPALAFIGAQSLVGSSPLAAAQAILVQRTNTASLQCEYGVGGSSGLVALRTSATERRVGASAANTNFHDAVSNGVLRQHSDTAAPNSMRRNRTGVAAGAASTSTGPSLLEIGARNSLIPFNGSFGELVFFGLPLSAADRQVLEVNQMQTYGIELVTNGGFDTTSNWSTTSSAWQITGGKAVLDNTSGNSVIQQLINIPVGATATLGFDIDAISHPGALGYVRIGTSSTGVGTVDVLPAFAARPLGRNTVTFTNTTGSSSVWLKFGSDAGARTATIDNVRVTLS